MLKVKINGKTCEAEAGEYILDVCRRNRILVPTLCRHEGLAGLGACRLCVVEVNEGRGNNVVVSCVYPLSRDCEVITESEKIKGIRRTILSMMKTRAPAGDRLASLCQIYGVPETDRFTAPGSGKGGKQAARGGAKTKVENRIKADRMSEACVLCGLCAHACASLGTGAISTVSRGVSKKISTPYDEPSADCVGCGSCANVCPTKAIECTEKPASRGKAATRTIWGKEFRLLSCAVCGKAFATEEEYLLAQKKASLEHDAPQKRGAAAPAQSDPVCDVCRKKKSADVFAAAFGERA